MRLDRWLGTLAVACATSVLVSPVGATTPVSCPNGSIPALIALVGSTSGVPASALGQFTVVALNGANNPESFATITIDLSACDDLVLCEDQLDANVTVDCVNRKVSKQADITGTATFTILGGSVGGSASSAPYSGIIYQNSCRKGFVNVVAYDLDGASGMGAGDISVWISDLGGNWGRSDYDNSGTVGANDLSIWLGAWGDSNLYFSDSCTSSCP